MKVATLIYKLLDMILIVNHYLLKAMAFISCTELSHVGKSSLNCNLKGVVVVLKHHSKGLISKSNSVIDNNNLQY